MLRPIDSLPLFYAHALAIEREAASRLAEFEGYFNDRGDDALAGLCRELSVAELDHFRDLMKSSDGLSLPPIAAGAHGWLDVGAPDAPAHELFYRVVNPRQLLGIAASGERKAARFYRWVARTSREPSVRQIAGTMAREEKAHERTLDEAFEFRAPAVDWETLLAQGVGPGIVAPL